MQSGETLRDVLNLAIFFLGCAANGRGLVPAVWPITCCSCTRYRWLSVARIYISSKYTWPQRLRGRQPLSWKAHHVPSRPILLCCPAQTLPAHSTSVIYFFASWWPLNCITPLNRDPGAASMPNIAVNILLKTQRLSIVLHTETHSKTKTTQLFDSQDVKPRCCSSETQANQSQY